MAGIANELMCMGPAGAVSTRFPTQAERRYHGPESPAGRRSRRQRRRRRRRNRGQHVKEGQGAAGARQRVVESIAPSRSGLCSGGEHSRTAGCCGSTGSPLSSYQTEEHNPAPCRHRSAFPCAAHPLVIAFVPPVPRVRSQIHDVPIMRDRMQPAVRECSPPEHKSLRAGCDQRASGSQKGGVGARHLHGWRMSAAQRRVTSGNSAWRQGEGRGRRAEER